MQNDESKQQIDNERKTNIVDCFTYLITQDRGMTIDIRKR